MYSVLKNNHIYKGKRCDLKIIKTNFNWNRFTGEPMKLLDIENWFKCMHTEKIVSNIS